jgi:hypothetical protein
MSQLLTALGILALASPVRMTAIGSNDDQRRRERGNLARNLEIPTRYVHVHVKLGKIPTSLLFDDLRRPAARLDAIGELRKRLPEPCDLWLDHIIREDAWSDLSRCYVKESDDATKASVLKSTIRWLEAKLADGPQPPGGVIIGGEGGEDGAPALIPPQGPNGDGPRPR